jgi:hypothetical protein
MRTISGEQCNPDEWNRFAAEHGWFWHTTLWRDYTVAYSASGESDSAGFAIVDGEDLIAIAPAIVEHNTHSRATISYGGGPTWAPAVRADLDPSARAAVLDTCLAQLELIAERSAHGRLLLQLSPLVPHFPDRALEFGAATTRRGYRDASLTTRVIDLARSELDLMRDMSKGHRAAVRRGRDISTRVLADDPSFDAYRDLHRRAAGRTTRPSATFELMRDWMGLGHAVVVQAEIANEIVGATLLLLWGDGAYYASSATAPERNRDVIGHAMTWTAMKWLKQQGVRRYELGIQHRGVLPHDSSTPKEQNISLYKRGFGGLELPLIVRDHHQG